MRIDLSSQAESYLRELRAIEERVKLELGTEGPVVDAPAQYSRFRIRWIWHCKFRPVTVQFVVSDLEGKVGGAWIEIDHTRDKLPGRIDSWAKAVFAEVLVYASPSRGQAVIFHPTTMRLKFITEWKDVPVIEIDVGNGKARGKVVPWENLCSLGRVVGIQ